MRECIILDIDGTVADVRGLRHLVPKSWDESMDDFHAASMKADTHSCVANAVRVLAKHYPIVIVTARSDKYKEGTEKWLKLKDITYEAIYMRQEGDKSRSSVLKSRILHQLYTDGWKPVLAYEDDPSILRLWELYGIPTVRGEGW